MAGDPLSQQREHARVPRDHLSQPVHSIAGSAEKRAAGPPALEPACAARAMPANTDTHAVRSSMLSPSVNDLRKRKTERFLVIGKAICWRVGRTVILRR